MKRSILISGVVVGVTVVVGVIGFVVVHKLTSKTATHKVEIQISASGFSPNSMVVKAGTQVVWKNVDAAPHAVASNPYPSDSSVPGLHSKTILPSGSYTYTPTKAGVINYHDDTEPTHNGSIKVEK